MAKTLLTLLLLCGSLSAQTVPLGTVNPVIEWNRTLLVIVRTPGAQPPTIHSTRSFAILHAAVYDAINNIERSFSPYLVHLPDVPRHASEPTAADRPPMTSWWHSTQLFRRHSTSNFNRTWPRFRMEGTKLTASW